MPLKTGLFLILFLFTLQATRIKGKPVFERRWNALCLFYLNKVLEFSNNRTFGIVQHLRAATAYAIPHTIASYRPQWSNELLNILGANLWGHKRFFLCKTKPHDKSFDNIFVARTPLALPFLVQYARKVHFANISCGFWMPPVWLRCSEAPFIRRGKQKAFCLWPCGTLIFSGL